MSTHHRVTESRRRPKAKTEESRPAVQRHARRVPEGTLYLQKGSRFLWMQYWRDGARHRESTGSEKPKAAQEVLRAKMREIDLEKEKRRAQAGDGGAGRTGAQLCVRRRRA